MTVQLILKFGEAIHLDVSLFDKPTCVSESKFTETLNQLNEWI